jgi:hypothetical protein
MTKRLLQRFLVVFVHGVDPTPSSLIFFGTWTFSEHRYGNLSRAPRQVRVIAGACCRHNRLTSRTTQIRGAWDRQGSDWMCA